MPKCDTCGHERDDLDVFPAPEYGKPGCEMCRGTVGEPLDPGEHVNLDGGITIQRSPTNGNHYGINQVGGTLGIKAETIGQLAVLAGFEVGERSIDSTQLGAENEQSDEIE